MLDAKDLKLTWQGGTAPFTVQGRSVITRSWSTVSTTSEHTAKVPLNSTPGANNPAIPFASAWRLNPAGFGGETVCHPKARPFFVSFATRPARLRSQLAFPRRFLLLVANGS
ncbi:MAG: hypothetical protein EXS36_14225 [Pedosphaera sp.]|nr:hypothetical protein [Pedosphaera sp.]